MASPVFVAANKAFATAGGTLTVTDPGGGNFLLALGVVDPSTTGLTAPSGWTLFASKTLSDHIAYLWTAPRGTPAFGWTIASTPYAEIHVASYSGVHSTPIDGGCTAGNCFSAGATATSQTPPALTAQSDATLSAIFATDFTTGWSAAPGMTGYTGRLPTGGTVWSATGGDAAVALAGAITPPAITHGGAASPGVALHVVLASQAAAGGGGGGGSVPTRQRSLVSLQGFPAEQPARRPRSQIIWGTPSAASPYTPGPRRAIPQYAPQQEIAAARRLKLIPGLPDDSLPMGVWAPFPDADGIGFLAAASSPARRAFPVALLAPVAAPSADHTAVLVEAGWVLAAAQTESIDHTAALVEAGWVLVASQGESSDCTAALVEAGFVAAATQTVSVDHTGALSEASWSLSATQAVTVDHTGSLTDAGWVLAASGGFFAPGADHTAALVEAGWVLAASQAVSVDCTAALVDSGFVTVAAQDVSVGHTAALVEAGWTVAASASFAGPGVDHTAALVDAGWVLAATQSESLDHVAALVEAGFSAAATQAVSVDHAAALAEAGWVLAATAAFSSGAGVADHVASLVEASWTLSAAQGESVDHVASLVEAGWYASGLRVFGRLHIHVLKSQKPEP